MKNIVCILLLLFSSALNARDISQGPLFGALCLVHVVAGSAYVSAASLLDPKQSINAAKRCIDTKRYTEIFGEKYPLATRTLALPPANAASQGAYSALQEPLSNVLENEDPQTVLHPPRLVPRNLFKLSHLRELNFAHAHFGGQLPEAFKRLTQLETLILSHNMFEGPIPESIGKLKNLCTLDLSHNQLSGPAPKALGKLTYLTTLNLSHNHLSGAFPNNLQDLSSLLFLDLSHNQFDVYDVGILDNLNYVRANFSHNPLKGLLNIQERNRMSLDISFTHVDALIYPRAPCTHVRNDGAPLKYLFAQGQGARGIPDMRLMPIVMNADAFHSCDDWRRIYIQGRAKIRFQMPADRMDEPFPQYLQGSGITENTVITYKPRREPDKLFLFKDLEHAAQNEEYLRHDMHSALLFYEPLVVDERLAYMQEHYGGEMRAKSARSAL